MKYTKRDLPKNFKASDVNLGETFYLGAEKHGYVVTVNEIHYIKKIGSSPEYKFVTKDGLEFYFGEILSYCDTTIS